MRTIGAWMDLGWETQRYDENGRTCTSCHRLTGSEGAPGSSSCKIGLHADLCKELVKCLQLLSFLNYAYLLLLTYFTNHGQQAAAEGKLVLCIFTSRHEQILNSNFRSRKTNASTNTTKSGGKRERKQINFWEQKQGHAAAVVNLLR